MHTHTPLNTQGIMLPSASDGSISSLIQRYGIPVPSVCIAPDGTPDINLETVVVHLTRRCDEKPVLLNTVLVRALAIVCEEVSATSDASAPIYIAGAGGVVLPKLVMSDDDDASSAHAKDQSFVDVFLPGASVQRVRRIWVRPGAHAAVLQEHAPELLGDKQSPTRGIREHINPDTGLVEYYVSHGVIQDAPRFRGGGGGGGEDAAADPGIYCPMGVFTHAWFTKISPGGGSAPAQRLVTCPDGRERLGYVLEAAQFKALLRKFTTYRKDPRLEIAPSTFRLRGQCSSVEWSISMRLSIVYSVRT